MFITCLRILYNMLVVVNSIIIIIRKANIDSFLSQDDSSHAANDTSTNNKQVVGMSTWQMMMSWVHAGFT